MKLSVQLALAIVTCLPLGCGGGDETGGPGGVAGASTTGGISGVGGTATSGAATGGAVGQAGTTTSGGATSGGSATGGTATGGTATGGAATGGSATGGSAGTGGTMPTDGPGLYNANCFVCHGEQGVGGPLGPETQHPVRDYSSWVVRHGRAQTTFPKPMEIVPPEKLSDAQLTLIWDYLDQPPQPTTGQALYHDYCANCHGADGNGGPTTRPILNELPNLKKQVRDGAHLGQFDMRREYMPAWTTSKITDAELDLIYKYVESL